MKLRNCIFYLFVFLFITISIYKVVDICLIKKQKYTYEYKLMSNRVFTGSKAPRGRILDINGKVLVDNIGVKTIFYNKPQGFSKARELKLAQTLSNFIDIPEEKITNTHLKYYYLATHNDGSDLITNEEWELLNKRMITKKEIDEIKKKRITDEILSVLTTEERKTGYIYYLMNKDYAFDSKIIKKEASDKEVALVCSKNYPGISCGMTWKRTYPYGTLLRNIFGNISIDSIPKELKDYYTKQGLPLNSSVGISYLELKYDRYLRGKDEVLSVDQLGNVKRVSNYEKGSDLYLSIDIDLQQSLVNIMKNEMTLAKKASNTDYYDRSFVIIGHPLTGEIVAMAGQKITNDGFLDITSDVINTSYTVGSIVKGASISVGYKEGIIKKGKKIKDACIKVYGVPKKCSWKSLGMIDEISAIAYSSNYYQFNIATMLANPQYKWNSKLNVTSENYKTYRDVFASYGLGVKTGIDLPNEKIGIIGKKESDDLYLNLAIGQYDTYTPIEVFQYINTIANDGIRIKPTLMNKIVNGDKIIANKKIEILNNSVLNSDDMKSVQKGLEAVMKYGTGKNYNSTKVQAAGKTGTSETFVDSDNDGIMDTLTTSTSFITYAPIDTKEYSIVIISPNIAKRKENTKTYKYALNLKLNRKIMELLFENV